MRPVGFWPLSKGNGMNDIAKIVLNWKAIASNVEYSNGVSSQQNAAIQFNGKTTYIASDYCNNI